MGWQALQVTDFKDPHYPAICLITRRSQVQILPRVWAIFSLKP
jgi:hypothetical protein